MRRSEASRAISAERCEIAGSHLPGVPDLEYAHTTWGNQRRPLAGEYAQLLPLRSSTGTCALMSRLDWIPNKLRPPRYLKDFQRSWFMEIVTAMFENDEMQGYLPKTENLWRIAGSHDRAMWRSHCAAVMEAFESAQVSGREVIFYRPLLDLIETQRTKLRGNTRARADPSSLQSVLDFDLKKENGSEREKPAKSAKLLEREERDRESALQRAKKRGLA